MCEFTHMRQTQLPGPTPTSTLSPRAHCAHSLPAWELPWLGTALPGPHPPPPPPHPTERHARAGVDARHEGTRGLWGKVEGLLLPPWGWSLWRKQLTPRADLAWPSAIRAGWEPRPRAGPASTTQALGRVGQWSGATQTVPASEPPRPALILDGPGLWGPWDEAGGSGGRGPGAARQQERAPSSSGLREARGPLHCKRGSCFFKTQSHF